MECIHCGEHVEWRAGPQFSAWYVTRPWIGNGACCYQDDAGVWRGHMVVA